MRKYLFEAGLDVFTSFKTIIPVESLKDLRKVDKHNYHIYGILSYDQVFFDCERTKTTENGIQIEMFTMNEERKQYKLPLMVISPDLDHRKVKLKISFPSIKMNICIEDEEFLKNHPEYLRSETNIMAQDLFERMAENLVNKQEYEVLYIGQAYVKNGSRTAFDRLEAHSTLQKILINYRDRNPNKHIYILLMELKEQLTMTFDGISKNYIETETENNKHIEKIFCNLPKENQVINITEAALINYFKPEYNADFVENFPNENHKGYRQYFDLDYNIITVELDLEFDHSPIVQLYTATDRIDDSTDIICYKLFNDNERSNMYEMFCEKK